MMCGRGGTGRRATLRSLWPKGRGSSSLLDRTISFGMSLIFNKKILDFMAGPPSGPPRRIDPIRIETLFSSQSSSKKGGPINRLMPMSAQSGPKGVSALRAEILALCGLRLAVDRRSAKSSRIGYPALDRRLVPTRSLGADMQLSGEAAIGNLTINSRSRKPRPRQNRLETQDALGSHHLAPSPLRLILANSRSPSRNAASIAGTRSATVSAFP